MTLKMALVTCCVLLVCMSVARGQQQRQDTGPLTCTEKVKKEIEEDSKMPMVMDKEYPQCDDGGNYKAKQCYGTWTGHGHCSCVDPVSGVKFTDVKGISYRSLQGAAMTCRCALDYSNDATARASFCDLETGDYKSVVCIDEQCRCAERWGAPMNGFSAFKKGDSNCLCARRLADVSGLIGTTYNCDTYGRFNPVQCRGSQCSCVDDEGIRVGLPVFISKSDTLKC